MNGWEEGREEREGGEIWEGEEEGGDEGDSPYSLV